MDFYARTWCRRRCWERSGCSVLAIEVTMEVSFEFKESIKVLQCARACV